MKQRVYLNFVISLLVLILVVNLVSARSITEDIKNVGTGVYDVVKPVFEAILGVVPEDNGQQYLFAKVLFFLIVLSIIWVTLSKIDFFSDNSAVLWVISIAASVLAVRWIGGKAVIDTIILPYSALGITVSALLPFVLYFFIIEVGLGDPKPRTLRRVAWVFFAVVFIGLWLSRDESLLTAQGSYAGYIYPVTAALALVVLFMDGTIQKMRVRMATEKLRGANKERLLDNLRDELHELDDRLTRGTITRARHTTRVKEINKKIDALLRSK